jgi:adenylylsulfate kinase
LSSAGGAVVWITGRPASGKSTLGLRLAALLRGQGVPCALLDGDEVRQALGRPAGRGPEERAGYYEALARMAALLARQGLVAVVAATANRRAHRQRARALAPAFVEVLVATPAEECERRDPKGLYARARAGETAGLPGPDEPFEEPAAPEVVARGGEDQEAAERTAALLRAARAGPRPDERDS